jgi:hypothetical protein
MSTWALWREDAAVFCAPLLVGGPVLGPFVGLLFGSLETTALAFGFGAVH